MINFNKLIPLTSDDLFERVDYERLAERFPVPSIRRGASPEPISELRAGVRAEYLGVYVQFVAREPGSYGRDCLTLQISDETGHMQALWTLAEGRANLLIEQIGAGREAVVSGIVHEWPLGSGDMRMVLDDVDLEKVILAIIEPPLTGTIDTVMQIVPKLERLPKPVASLVIDLLESHWQELLNGIDYESLRHRYHGGILGHLRSVLKILEYLWSRPGLDMAILDFATTYQAQLESDGPKNSYRPISIDFLHQVLVKMRRALDLNPDGPWYYVVCLAAVAVEIGKLSTTVRARVVEELSHNLKKMVDEYVLSREDADQVLNLVTRGFLCLENAQSAEELSLFFAGYLASSVG